MTHSVQSLILDSLEMNSEIKFDQTLLRRLSDISSEPEAMLMAIEGYEEMELVPLEESVKPLFSIVHNIRRTARKAKRFSQDTPGGLSCDESGSIRLYTAEWESYTDSVYYILNKILRTNDREHMKPWFLYLKLLTSALHRLPSIGKSIVYRGVKLDLRHLYPEGKIFVWRGFSSCTMNMNVLEEEQFFGKTAARTLFAIECYSGKDIHQHSYVQRESEVLLMAGTQFIVVACLDQGPNLYLVQLKEIKPTVSSAEPLADFPSSVVPSSTSKPPKRSLLTKYGSMLKTALVLTESEDYSNSKLTQLIAKYEPRSVINLERKLLADQDILIVVQQAMNGKQCTMLRLSNNRIKTQGASILANALRDNSTMEGLYIFGNRVGDGGVCFLAQALAAGNVTLRALSLGRNDITDYGAEHLAEMLKTNTTLIELCLPWNQISDHGVQKLADALIHYNRSLTRLFLDLNPLISDASIDILIEMMTENKSLIVLGLCDCKLSKAGKAKLRDAARLQSSIELNLTF